MLDLRPLWGLIVLLNFCVIIWHVTLLGPNIYETQTVGVGGGGGGGVGGGGGSVVPPITSSHAINANFTATEIYKHFQQQHHQHQKPKQQQQGQKQRHHLFQGKHLLSDDTQSGQSTTEIKSIETNFLQTNYNFIALSNPLGPLNATLATPVSLDNALPLDNVAIPAPATPTPTAVSAFQFAAGDFAQLIDLRNFSYLMTQPSCHHRIEALILVHSAPHNFEKRQQIRNTWGGDILSGSPIRCLFLLGAVNETTLQASLEQENEIYKDIIQGTFVDSYRNMTYKHVMVLKWFLYNCAQAQILIKVDDDILVNTPLLLKMLRSTTRTNNATHIIAPNSNETHTQNHTEVQNTTFFSELYNYFIKPIETVPTSEELSHILFEQPQNLLFCLRLNNARVMRSYRSKWRVAFKEYRGRYYPPYCPGFAIIYSPDVVFRLYNAAQQNPYFWVDDVHITGFMSQRTNITITTSKPYVTSWSLAENIDLSRNQFLFSLDRIKPTQQNVIWQLMIEASKQDASEMDTKLSTPLTQSSNTVDYKKSGANMLLASDKVLDS